MRRFWPGLLLLTMILVLAGGDSAAAAPSVTACATRLPVGIQLEGLGRFADAESYYAKQLETPAQGACAAVLLGRLAGLEGPCAYADFLKALGQADKAREAYARAALASPTAACAERGKRKPWLDRLEGFVALAGRWVLLALELGTALAVLAVLVLCTGHWAWAREKLLNLGRVRRLLAARLQVNEYKDGGVEPALGAELSALVRGHLRDPPRDVSSDVKLVSGSEALAHQLADLKDLTPQLGVMVAVLGLLDHVLPRKQFVADGVLQADAAHGVGIRLGLGQGKYDGASYGVAAEALFFLYAADQNPQAIERLAMPAAAWLEHQVATRSSKKVVTCADSGSYVLLRVGLEWQSRGEKELALALYEKALERDPANAGALANRAIIRADAHQDHEAIEDLTDALERVEGWAPATVKPARPRLAPDWYRIKYSLAAVYLNRLAEEAAGTLPDTEAGRAARRERDTVPGRTRIRKQASEAERHARELTLAVTNAVVWIDGKPWRRRRYELLEKFLRMEMEPCAFPLLAVARLYDTGRPDRRAPIRDREQLRAAVGSKQGGPAPGDVADFVVSHFPDDDTQANYNLACYYATAFYLAPTEQLARNASDRLTAALKPLDAQGRRVLTRSARTDPSFAALRGRASFDTLVGDGEEEEEEVEESSDPWCRDLRAALIARIRADPAMTAEVLAATTGLPPAYVNRIFTRVRAEALANPGG